MQPEFDPYSEPAFPENDPENQRILAARVAARDRLHWPRVTKDPPTTPATVLVGSFLQAR